MKYLVPLHDSPGPRKAHSPKQLVPIHPEGNRTQLPADGIRIPYFKEDSIILPNPGIFIASSSDFRPKVTWISPETRSSHTALVPSPETKVTPLTESFCYKQLLHIPRHIGYLRGGGLTVPQPLMHISGLRLRRKQSPRILHHLPAGIAALNIFIELILHCADFLLNHGKGILRLLPLLRRPNRGKKNRNAQKTQHAQYQNRRRISQKLPPVYLYLQKEILCFLIPAPFSSCFPRMQLSAYSSFLYRHYHYTVKNFRPQEKVILSNVLSKFP